METGTVYSRKNPFQAKVIQNINLNGKGSKKETRHIVLSLKDSGLSFEPGDCLGIYPQNDPELVSELMKVMNWNELELVAIDKESMLPLQEALTGHFEITLLTKKLVQDLAKLSSNTKLQSLASAGNEEAIKEYVEGRDLLDLLIDFAPWEVSAGEIVSHLRKITPRLYSIASSFRDHPDEVHLTIGAVRYESHGRKRKGVCSVQCAERLEVGDTIPVFIQKNNHFRLPEDNCSDIIMIGPGTGIAPFRSFIQERKVQEAKGRIWLYFGDQHEETDFLYRQEFKEYENNGILTKLSTAFSRDSDKKVYVQHRMLENSRDMFQWIQNGAFIYVCGDKQHMAKDVHNALIEIVRKEGNCSIEEAEKFVEALKKQHKYQQDVY